MLEEPPNLPSAEETFLIDWLKERDEPCPLCEYNLRGLTVPRCPECGNALRVSVTLLEPYIKAWIALAIAICGSAGMGIMFAFVVLRAGMPRQGMVDWAVLFFILTVPTPLFLLRKRRQFQKLPRYTQWTYALTADGISLAALIILCAGIR